MAETTGKISILLLSAAPTDAGRLRLDQEFRDIQEKLKLAMIRDRFIIEAHTAVRPSDIVQGILDINPQIVHFSGHGVESGELCVEDDDGTTHILTPKALSSLFALTKNHVQCVVLNACFSEIQAHAIAEHIEYVIGMKKAIGDHAAIAFAVGFYRALGAGKSIEDAFGFGIVELKMLNIPEYNTPVLIKKSIKLEKSDKEQQVNELLNLEMWKSLHDHAYNYLIKDQIKESGGWGYSQVEIMEEASKRAFSQLEKEEGGIISTYLAIKALSYHENNPFTFRSRDYSHKAMSYFLRRQTHKGSFGRFISSRSGLEIHPSIRHTALSVSALLELNGPPGSIFRGLSYLKDNWEIVDILDDASPSLAITSIIHAIDKFIATPIYMSFLNDEEKKEVDFSEWTKISKSFSRQLIELSKSSNEYPFFEPYGHNKPLLFETAVTTIDLLPNPFSKEIAIIIADIISAMIDCSIENGLPYNPYTKTPDIGMSSYFLLLILRKDIFENINNPILKKRIEDFSIRLSDFILKNYNNQAYWKYTHCDTIASLLYIK